MDKKFMQSVTKIVGVCLAFSPILVFALIFYTAYFSSNYQVVVDINNHNEALIEAFVFIPTCLFAYAMTIVFTIKDVFS